MPPCPWANAFGTAGTHCRIWESLGVRTRRGQAPRRLGPDAWRRLHTTGIWVVWAIFFLCLVDSVGRKATAHPLLAYHLFIAVLLLGLAMRVAAARRRQSSATPVGP